MGSNKKKPQISNKLAVNWTKCMELIEVFQNPCLSTKQKKDFMSILNDTQIEILSSVIHEFLYKDHGFQIEKDNYLINNENDLVKFANKDTSIQDKRELFRKKGGFLQFFSALAPIVAPLVEPIVKGIGKIFK